MLGGRAWEEILTTIHDSIVFIDEGNSFVNSREFAHAIRGTDNYYVLITRESLYQLPYSVDSVLELHKSGSRKNRTYTKAYPYYKQYRSSEQLQQVERILTEDRNSGHEMFSAIAAKNGKTCDSAEGKSNILTALMEHPQATLVVADGAAFGAEMDKVYRYIQGNAQRMHLYLPESFEWLLLKAGVVRQQDVTDILANPSAYIESSEYFSWEQFFTELLVGITQEPDYMRYNKRHLVPYYLQERNVERVERAMEAE